MRVARESGPAQNLLGSKMERRPLGKPNEPPQLIAPKGERANWLFFRYKAKTVGSRRNRPSALIQLSISQSATRGAPQRAETRRGTDLLAFSTARRSLSRFKSSLVISCSPPSTQGCPESECAGSPEIRFRSSFEGSNPEHFPVPFPSPSCLLARVNTVSHPRSPRKMHLRNRFRLVHNLSTS